MYGWAGQRLKVFLTEGKIVKEPLSEELRLDYLGGRGLNSKALLDEVQPGIDPLSSDNVVMVGVGPLNGTAAPTSSRWTVTAKSTIAVPGGIGDGNGGGDFSSELKFAGYDQIIFYGRSPKPVYLWISDDHVELRDASHLWGQTTVETNNLLWKELRDREVRVLCIGPAGENLVRTAKAFSNITRTGGKGGIGAVMGSKNLKAVAVRGTGAVKIARPAEFLKVVKRRYDRLMASPTQKTFRETGTLAITRRRSVTRALSTRNGQASYFEGWEKLTSEAFHEAGWEVRHRGCAACPISCGHYYQIKEGPYACHGESPEYGTTYPFGSKCSNDNFAAILKMARMCDELGLDTHSTGNTMSFAMHCRQEGLLTIEDTDNIDLKWGNADAMIQMLPRIAYRQGFGAVLAEGSQGASEHIPGSEAVLRTVKGQEVSALQLGPGANRAEAIGYATSTRGADHLRGLGSDVLGLDRLKEALGPEVYRRQRELLSIEGKGILVAFSQNMRAAINCLELCTWGVSGGVGGGGEELQIQQNYDEIAELVSTATGVDLSCDDLLKTGERIYNVEKAFNIREGMRRKDDYLPQWLLVEKETPWGTEGITEEKYQSMLDEYYRFRGWDREGIPTKQKLEELGLGYIEDQVAAARASTAS